MAELDNALAALGYVDLRPLGRGGFGTVFSGHDVRLDRDVAIKVVSETASGVSKEALLNEARIGALLHHPNLMPVFAADTLPDGAAYIVMPLADADLTSRVPLDLEVALRVGVKLASALQTLHEAGIVHGDINPRNVLFFQGEPVLADFGLAQVYGKSMLRGFTAPFAAPEVLEGQPPDAASDVYGLAVTLLFPERAKTSKPSSADWRNQFLDVSVRMDLPEAGRSAFEHALAADPRQRPTAMTFGRTLEAAQEAAGLPVTELLVREPAVRATRPRPSPIERDQAEILAHSVQSAAARVLSGALKVEDRQQRQLAGMTAIAAGLGGLVSLVATFLASDRSLGDHVHAAIIVPTVLVTGLVLLVAIAPKAASVFRRKRAASMSRQALELSARMRNAYLKELAAIRYESVVTTEQPIVVLPGALTSTGWDQV